MEAAKGDVIAKSDTHAELTPGALTAAVRILQEAGAVNIGSI